MDNSFRGQITESVIDICEHFMYLIWLQCSSFLDFCLKITLVTMLSDDVAVSIAGKNFQTFENVGMVQFFKDCDLREK